MLQLDSCVPTALRTGKPCIHTQRLHLLPCPFRLLWRPLEKRPMRHRRSNNRPIRKLPPIFSHEGPLSKGANSGVLWSRQCRGLQKRQRQLAFTTTTTSPARMYRKRGARNAVGGILLVDESLIKCKQGGKIPTLRRGCFPGVLCN